MNKVDQIMELVEEYVESSTQSEQDWKFSHKSLKAAIEELVKDAARYRFIADGYVHVGPCRNPDGTIESVYTAIFPAEFQAISASNFDAFLDAAMGVTP